MSNKIWVVVADDVPQGPVLALAQGTGKQVEAVAVGPRRRAEAAADAGADAVIWYPCDESLPAETCAESVAKAAQAEVPCAIVSSSAPAARVIVARIAAQLGIPIIPFITAIEAGDGAAVVEHAVAEGRSIEPVEVEGPFAGFAVDGSNEADARMAPPITEVACEADARMTVVATAENEGGADLANADRVVGVGRGFCTKDALGIGYDLAEALHAEVACSLPMCDNFHWFEHSRVVGTSTQKISPRLYVALGISGQPQHMAGVRGAKTIVAVNEDPEAPIFRECDYGIIGDLEKIAPVFAQAIRSI